MNMNRNSFGISDCYNRVFLFISQRRTEYKKKDEKTTYKYFIQLQSLCGLLKKVPQLCRRRKAYFCPDYKNILYSYFVVTF